jgi:hypothetical protein
MTTDFTCEHISVKKTTRGRKSTTSLARRGGGGTHAVAKVRCGCKVTGKHSNKKHGKRRHLLEPGFALRGPRSLQGIRDARVRVAERQQFLDQYCLLLDPKPNLLVTDRSID